MKLMVKHKIIGLAIISAFLPVFIMSILTAFQKGSVNDQTVVEMDILAKENITQVAKDVYGMVKAANDLVQNQVNSNLNVARSVVGQLGSVTLSSRRNVTWQAVNQYSKAAHSVTIPAMYAGNIPFEDNRSFSSPTPVVDYVEQLVGGTCTVFQRMNESGDMLRIATNVKKLNGERAVGTYIPSVNPDGTSNPVIRAVMNGQTYRGRAFVVNEWYITAYEPIRNRNNRIIGVLYVGVKQENVPSIRQAIMDITVGKTGYVYVLGGKGDQKGDYLISKGGARDGENIWGAKDSDGRLFIQVIVNKAVELKGSNVDYETYPWLNVGEDVARTKIAAIAYFEPWDWVIGAGTYEDDYYGARNKVNSALNNLLLWLVIGGLVILGAMSFAAFNIGNRIGKPMSRMAEVAMKLAKGDINEEVVHQSDDETGKLAASFREMITALKEKAEAADNISKGLLNVDIDVASEGDVLGKAMVSMVEAIKKLASDTNELAAEASLGKILTRSDSSNHEGEYKNLIDALNKTLDNVVGHIDNITAPVMIMDKEFNIQYLNNIGCSLIGLSQDQLKGQKCYSHFKTEDCQTNNCACFKAMSTGNTSSSETIARPLDNVLDIAYTGFPLKDDKGVSFAAVETITDVTQIKNAQRKVEKIAKYQENEIEQISGILSEMAGGNLTETYSICESDKDTEEVAKVFTGMQEALNATLASLNDILGQVNIAVEQVSSGSQQVSDSSQSLSQGATEQASSLEETSSSVTEMASQTKQNAENATQANTLASDARGNADEGNEQMGKMLEAMTGINESSDQISKIIKVIDEIAFQTNLLALNAAVEAARAGVHGKGFAVVAEEVRNLAMRSAKAAKETTELIEDSINRVENGTSIANDTAKALEEIVNGITKVTDLVGEIASASKDQAQGIDQINEALAQIDQVTQSNTANAEESASASEELSSQAMNLKQMIAKFKLNETSVKQLPPATHHREMAGAQDASGTWGNSGKAAGKTPAESINLDDEDFGEF